MSDPFETFLDAVRASIRDNTFVKLTLGTCRGPDPSLRKLFVKPVALARGDQLSFVFRHAARDVTKNRSVEEGLALVRTLLGSEFWSANLFTTAQDSELTFNKRRQPRLRTSAPTHTAPPSKEHNRRKRRAVASHEAPYLALLGVTGSDGAVKKGMEAKFRQINKFIEIVGPLVRSSPLNKAGAVSVMDMGSGKGYLTFALYDFLTNMLKKTASVTGVEARPELVDLCNRVAASVGFAKLRFECGSIENVPTKPADVIIALHACNTATDEALFKAVRAQASLILCAPCCHKELRPQMRRAAPGFARILQSGILRERQAELVTDALRALLLEAAGYRTKVFEFIATEHTSKNVMIAAVKTKRIPDRDSALRQVDALKQAFGIEHQYLETLLSKRGQESDVELARPPTPP
jgi:SAM-dependent methyltransferase